MNNMTLKNIFFTVKVRILLTHFARVEHSESMGTLLYDSFMTGS